MNIYEKLLAFKAKNITLVKDTKWFNYKYAELWQIQDKIEPILQELKLFVNHFTKWNSVYTKIVNVENPEEFIESHIDIGKITTTKTLKNWDIEIQEQDPQAVWAIITYYRRYNLVQMLDLQTEDDDASSASSRAKAKNEYTWAKVIEHRHPRTDMTIMDYVTAIWKEKDLNALKIVFEEALEVEMTEPQREMLISAKDTRKKYLMENTGNPFIK